MYRLQSAPPRVKRFVYREGLPLSRREQQVLRLMCKGLAPYEIAAKLSRAHQTIQTHIGYIRQKTGCRTQAQLGVWAVRHGLVSTDCQ